MSNSQWPASHGGSQGQIARAAAADLPLVMEIVGEAAAWLAARGIDQWPSPPNDHWRRRTAAAIARGEIYLAYEDGDAVGTLGLTWTDPYWPDDDGQAGYVHRLALRDGRHGRGLGAALLAWAAVQVRRRGRTLLRLDAPAGNGRLRRYYEELGFNFRGEVADRDYLAALYEKAA